MKTNVNMEMRKLGQHDPLVSKSDSAGSPCRTFTGMMQ